MSVDSYTETEAERNARLSKVLGHYARAVEGLNARGNYLVDSDLASVLHRAGQHIVMLEAENAALQDQLKLAELWRTGYEQAKAENAALREWESRCAVALGVPGCHPEEMLHVIDNQREDAERYRWFRSKSLWDADSFPWPKDFEYPEPCLWDDGEMLDAAIDAARKT